MPTPDWAGRELVRQVVESYLRSKEPQELADLAVVFDRVYNDVQWDLAEARTRALGKSDPAAEGLPADLRLNSALVDTTTLPSVIWLTSRVLEIVLTEHRHREVLAVLGELLGQAQEKTPQGRRLRWILEQLLARVDEVQELRAGTTGKEQVKVSKEGSQGESPGEGRAPGVPSAFIADLILLVFEERQGIGGAPGSREGSTLRYHLYSWHEELQTVFDTHQVGVHLNAIATLEGLFRRIESWPLRNAADHRAATERLASLGVDLFERLFPVEMRRKLWRIHGEIQSVHVFSNEASIPWEVLKLKDPDGNSSTSGPFFGEAFAVTRWLFGCGECRCLPLSRMALVVPRELEVEAKGKEAGFVLSLARERAMERVEARFNPILDSLAAGDHDGWHVITHGLARGEDADQWSLQLEAGEILTPRDLRDRATGVGRRRPLVFLNACHSGRGGLALTGIGGWAPAFLRAGAGAFLGAHWAVLGEASSRFAEVFYSQFLAGIGLGEAVRQARMTVKEEFPGDPTWLSYTVFGHPLATMSGRAAHHEYRGERFSTIGPAPFMAEPPPDDFILRRELSDQALDCLLAPTIGPGRRVLAFWGAGGSGKTTLARALCQEPRLRQAFPDGILWLTLGEQPRDLIGHIEDLIYTLQGHRPGFAHLDGAVAQWNRSLEGLRTLLVIDDAWQKSHVEPFLRGLTKTRILVTTRDRTVLPSEVVAVAVAEMDCTQASDLLAAGLPSGNRSAIERLARRLGNWPLLLRLANAVLRDRTNYLDQDLADALIFVHAALEEQGLTAFDAANPVERHQAVASTIEVSLRQLTPRQSAHYRKLVIFPEDVTIPLTTLQVLWRDRQGLQTEADCARFHQLSLLASADLGQGQVRLHDVIRGYLLRSWGEEVWKVHHDFLREWRFAVDPQAANDVEVWPWDHLPEKETYMWSHLVYHLAQAGEKGPLLGTIKDLKFLAKRIARGEIHGVVSDIAVARRSAPSDPDLPLLYSNLSNFKHILLRCEKYRDALVTLYLRLHDCAEFAPLSSHLTTTLDCFFARPRFPLPDAPHPALLLTLAGHEDSVNDCAINATGDVLVSCGSDGTVRVWDPVGGVEVLRFEESVELTACALDARGRRLLAPTTVGLKIWDLPSGVERWRLSSGDGPASGCALDASGRRVVGTWKDGTVVSWCLPDTRPSWSARVESPSLGGCSLSADGKWMVSTSGRNLVLWDVDHGRERLRFVGHDAAIWSCDISSDGSLIASTDDHAVVKVWEATTGRCLRTIDAGALLAASCSFAAACRLSPDGVLLLACGVDSLLRIWNWRDGQLQGLLEAHAGPVEACAFSGDGVRILSGGADDTLRLWDANRANVKRRSELVGNFLDCAVAGDGRSLLAVTQAGQILRWDAGDGTALPPIVPPGRGARTVCSTHDGRSLILGDRDGRLSIWDLTTCHHTATLLEDRDPLWKCALALSKDTIFAATSSGALHRWKLCDLQPLPTIATDSHGAESCAAAINGQRVALPRGDDHILLVELSPGSNERLLVGHTDQVNTCKMSADGNWLLSGGDDGKVLLWDLSTGKPAQVLLGHQAPVWSCALEWKLRLALSAGPSPYGGEARIWDLSTGVCQMSLIFDSELSACAWLPDGSGFLLAGEKGLFVLDLLGPRKDR